MDTIVRALTEKYYFAEDYELAEVAGIPLAHLQVMLWVLESEGKVEQDSENGGWKISPCYVG